MEGMPIAHNHEANYNLPPMRIPRRDARTDTRYTETTRQYNTRRDLYRTRSNKILATASNVDSGLGESTPQEFSSRCSSSADSTKLPTTRATQLQIGGEGHYELSSNQENYAPVDATLDAVLQPIISTLTRRQRNRKK